MDDKAYEQFVADVVRCMSFSNKTQVFTNKHYRGVRQPGTYEIDVSCEVWIDDALFFLIIVECKNWTRPIDRPQVQKLIQTRDAISAHKAAFASPVGYSKEAIEVAKANGVALWVVAKGIFDVAAGGGLAALSMCFRISDYLRTLLYMSISYDFQYSRNLLDGYPNLIPFSWLPSNTASSLATYPTYEAVSPYASAYDPIVSQLILHTLASKPETNTLTMVMHDAITKIHQILQEAGLNALQSDFFLREFAIKMVTEGISIEQFFARLESFDKTVPHARISLRAPMEWVERYGREFFIYSTNDSDDSFLSLRNNIVWANVAWLFTESEETRQAT